MDIKYIYDHSKLELALGIIDIALNLCQNMNFMYKFRTLKYWGSNILEDSKRHNIIRSNMEDQMGIYIFANIDQNPCQDYTKNTVGMVE